MVRNEKNVTIYGKTFSIDVYNYFINRFKEAFSHCSLTIEEAYANYENFNMIINTGKNELAYNFFQLCNEKTKRMIKQTCRQMIVFKAAKIGAFKETVDFNDMNQVNRLFENNFGYFVPDMFYYIVFDKNGNFDANATVKKLDTLFFNSPQRKTAYELAYNMKKDNLDAFDYSMKKDKIDYFDVIEINSIVNKSNPDKEEGFKKTNNDIFSASFTPTDKESVPFEMHKLFDDYNNSFGLDIKDPFEKGILPDEKNKRLFNISLKEAIFHIRFERIHPFADGNGRTGRIILNHNLLNQGIAPILIPNVTSNYYKQCINNNDYEGLASIILNNSTTQMANWISLCKGGIDISKKEANPDNFKLAEIESYDDGTQQKKFFFKKNY